MRKLKYYKLQGDASPWKHWVFESDFQYLNMVSLVDIYGNGVEMDIELNELIELEGVEVK